MQYLMTRYYLSSESHLLSPLKAFHFYNTNFSLYNWIILINILVFYLKKTKHKQNPPDSPSPFRYCLPFLPAFTEKQLTRVVYSWCFNIFNSTLLFLNLVFIFTNVSLFKVSSVQTDLWDFLKNQKSSDPHCLFPTTFISLTVSLGS